jgi:hypothetical protein
LQIEKRPGLGRDERGNQQNGRAKEQSSTT